MAAKTLVSDQCYELIFNFKAPSPFGRRIQHVAEVDPRPQSESQGSRLWRGARSVPNWADWIVLNRNLVGFPHRRIGLHGSFAHAPKQYVHTKQGKCAHKAIHDDSLRHARRSVWLLCA